MKATYSTGRDYGSKQVLDIEYVPFTGGDWDDDACDLVAVSMNDSVRGLNYMLRVVRFACTPDQIGAAVLQSYDNNYQAPWDSKVGDRVVL
jgi:hypothetical protein